MRSYVCSLRVLVKILEVLLSDCMLEQDGFVRARWVRERGF
jgi:hypothetical protein